ncbi:MAG TPA: DUF4097 family beta strand repeat-containing protein [Candidatus Deferrimicrobiaceae bacterium]|nr:DUF4097 family beta strand repeat-containing protein [Candidatus Deferrimicrobiaceae bacterium]
MEYLKRLPQFVGVLSVLAMLAPLVLAQETRMSREGDAWSQELTGSLSAVKILRVKVDVGSVTVKGGSLQGISYVVHTRSYNSSEQDARRQFESYKVNAYVRGDTAWIVGDWQGRRPRKFSGEFAINVPREITLVKIETEGGNIDTSGVAGRVEAESGGGSMHLDDIGGGAHAETGGGAIDVGTINGDIGLHTGGGSIKVHHANGMITAETGGGSVEIVSATQGASIETGGGGIEVRQCTGKVKAETGGGNIDLGDIGGPAEIETGGGTIHLASAKGHVHAQTGGGGIELNGVPSAQVETGAGGIVVKFVKTGAPASDSKLETSAGDITVYIAPGVALSVRASVDLGNGHHITSDFPDIHVASEGDKWGPRTLNAEGSLNGGGPVLKVRTTTGDICFRRANQ